MSLPRRTFRVVSELPARCLLPLLTLLVPRDKRLWAFGSWAGMRFADNAKQAFLHCVERGDVTAVWITRNRAVYEDLSRQGLPVLLRQSWKGVWIALRAGVYVFDVSPNDINYAASRGAYLANLWHGVPLKKIEHDIDTPGHFIFEGLHGGWLSRLHLRVRQPWMFRRYDFVSCTSEALVPIFSSAFSIPAERVKVVGFPRNDVLFSPDEVAQVSDEFARRVKDLKAAGERVVLVMPTFREGRASIAWSPDEQRLLEGVLARHGCTMLIKLHPIDRSKWSVAGDVTRIVEVPQGADAYTLLASVDFLVTDYSSVFFDYLVLDRPMIFLCHDLEVYLASDRGMYFEYESVTPGGKARSFDEFLACLSECLQGRDPHALARRNLQARIHKYLDGSSAQRACDEIQAAVAGG